MSSLVFIVMGGVSALAAFLLLAKTRVLQPKKAEKGEKGEIIKQLLALAEQEKRVSAGSSASAGNLRPASTSSGHNGTLQNSTHLPVSSSRSGPRAPSEADKEIEARIRQRAYELYQGRGGVGGNAADDWRQAREEVLGRKAKAATASS